MAEFDYYFFGLLEQWIWAFIDTVANGMADAMADAKACLVVELWCPFLTLR